MLKGADALAGIRFERDSREASNDCRAFGPRRYLRRGNRKGNKNDPNDAAAICEAVTRPSMRFVPIEQQDLQALHRVREQLIKNRTALANQIRGLLRERGIVVAQAIARLRRALPLILEDASNGAAARVAERKREARSIWLSRLKLRGGPNVAAVALANKNARVMWALLVRGDSYRVQTTMHSGAAA